MYKNYESFFQISSIYDSFEVIWKNIFKTKIDFPGNCKQPLINCWLFNFFDEGSLIPIDYFIIQFKLLFTITVQLQIRWINYKTLY